MNHLQACVGIVMNTMIIFIPHDAFNSSNLYIIMLPLKRICYGFNCCIVGKKDQLHVNPVNQF